MGIFKRIETITTATMHQVLDQVENPVAMLNQYMRDMEQEIAQAEVAIARQVAQEKNWEMLIKEAGERIAKRTRQAELAVAEGEDSIARQALTDKQQCEARKDEYTGLLEGSRQRTVQLREQLQELKDKFYEMRNKKAALISRARVAQTSKSMHTALHSIDTESAAKGFSRMEEKIAMLEADAEASRTIRFAYQPYASQHAEPNPQVEAELARLRAARSEAPDAEAQVQSK